MNRVILAIIALMVVQYTAFAGTAARTIMSAQSVTTGDTVYSSEVSARNASEYAALIVDLGIATGAGVTVTQQCSIDGSTWYSPVDKDNVSVGTTGQAITADKYIALTPVVTPYLRYKVVSATEDTVTLKYIWRE